MTGKFSDVIIPIKLIRSLVFIHEEKQTFGELERMIKQMDLTEYPYVQELEQLCQQIKEKIEQKERERIERERLEQESRERLYAAERVREERRVRQEEKREEYRRRRREKQIQEDYHDINKMSTNVQDAIMSGDQDAIMKMLFS